MPSQSESLKGQDNSISIGKKYTLESKILAEERPYWVRLPSSYEDPHHAPQHYPVLYLLDGDWNFYWVAGVMNFMGGMQTPEFIVIAVPNTDRTRDLTPTHTIIDDDGKESGHLETSGGGSAFLKFIREELFPVIEANYRTMPYRALVGHSLGGLLATQAILETKNMFQSYVAIDPSLQWDNAVLNDKLEQMLSEGKKLKANLFISLANNSDKTLETATRAFAKILEKFKSTEFDFKLQYFDDEDHGSVPLISLYNGLRHIFADYKMDVDAIIEQPSIVTVHFQAMSERLGIALQPPESFINDLGLHLLKVRDDADKALEFFKINAANYPQSYNVYKSLAEAYEAKGEKELAIEHYSKALELNPDVQEVKDQLQTLREASS